MDEDLASYVLVPPDAARIVRERLRVGDGEAPRIAFLAGPGDAAGTFEYWTRNRLDPRVPVVAYSTMFYTLVDKLGAEALVLTEPAGALPQSDRRFRFVRIPRNRSEGLAANVDWSYSSQVLRALSAFRPHVVILGTDAPLALFLALRRRSRILLTAHNTYWPMGLQHGSMKRAVKNRLIGWGLKRVRSGVCTSEECFRQVAALRGSDRGFTVEAPQVADAFFVTPRSAERARRILFLGRIEVDKGVLDLVDAFSALAQAHPDTELIIAGSGGAEAQLVDRIAASGASERIRFVGRLAAEQVHDELQRADLLVCPTRASFAEGLALVVAEAAVHGVPALVSSVVPAKDYAKDPRLEFPADDVAALRDRLDAIVSDPALFRDLRQRTARLREMFRDRSRSWGSELYKALVV